MNTVKKTVVFDFDGVVHSYTSGWQNECTIPDPPVDGIKEAIAEIREAGYIVVIVSTRCAYAKGKLAIMNWLEKYGIKVDGIVEHKPPAVVYIDDRAICFDGDSKSLLSKIKKFKPWNKR